MNYEAQFKLVRSLARRNIKVKLYLLEWQKKYRETIYYQERVRVGFNYISDHVIRFMNLE